MTTATPDKLLNLDHLAATCAQRIIDDTNNVEKSSDVENGVTKSLGVLQENGVYACFLFALSRAKPGDGGNQSNEAVIFSIIVREMLWVINELPVDCPTPPISQDTEPRVISSQAEQILNHVATHITKNLEHLLLAKEILEQMLIYARYGAKARSDLQNTTKDATL